MLFRTSSNLTSETYSADSIQTVMRLKDEFCSFNPPLINFKVNIRHYNFITKLIFQLFHKYNSDFRVYNLGISI